MRISDWSSDVCSSDLRRIVEAGDLRHPEPQSPGWPRAAKAADAGGALQDHRTTDRDWLLFPAGTPDSRCHLDHLLAPDLAVAEAGQADGLRRRKQPAPAEIGRASCRERVCQSV